MRQRIFFFLLRLPIFGVFSGSLFTFFGSRGSRCTCKVRVIFRLYIVFIHLCAILPSTVIVTCLSWTIDLYAIVPTDIIANRQSLPLHVHFHCYLKIRIATLMFFLATAPPLNWCVVCSKVFKHFFHSGCKIWQTWYHLSLLVNMLLHISCIHWYWCHSFCLYYFTTSWCV